MSVGEIVNPQTDQSCTLCYEVVPMGEIKSHREEVHEGRFADVEIVPIHKESKGLIAKARDMGHFSPHVFHEIDGHQMCGECGGVLVEERDVPEDLISERLGDESSDNASTGADPIDESNGDDSHE